MNWKYYLGISILGLTLVICLGLLQAAPGYMDAEYYYSMGLRIAKEELLTEPFVWNYLFEDSVLPHPGFTYWQPLPALVAAGGLMITGGSGFLSAKILFLLAYSLVPALVSFLSWELTQKRNISILAGFLALFPVFYSPFIVTTDSFGLMMIFGGIFFVAHKKRKDKRYIFLLGLASGLIHLSRADGLIWFGLGLLGCVLEEEDWGRNTLGFLLGYILIMGPWFLRNIIEFGELIPSGASRMFWLTEYNDIFDFHPKSLNFVSWKAQGIERILGNIFQAISANLKTAIFVQGQLFFAPLAVYGFWSRRKDKSVRLAILFYITIFGLMSVIFPFAGARGGFFHSGAGIQPMIWVMAAFGFGQLIDLGVKKRDWQETRAFTAFGAGMVLVFLVATGYIFFTRVYGENGQDAAWIKSERDAVRVAAVLEELDISDSSLVMINNPPGFFAATGRSSIVIPNGPVESLIEAAKEFGADILVLEANHSPQLDDLYNHPSESDQLKLIHSENGVHYFLVSDEVP
jgi:hypothetical protein